MVSLRRLSDLLGPCCGGEADQADNLKVVGSNPTRNYFRSISPQLPPNLPQGSHRIGALYITPSPLMQRCARKPPTLPPAPSLFLFSIVTCAAPTRLVQRQPPAP